MTVGPGYRTRGIFYPTNVIVEIKTLVGDMSFHLTGGYFHVEINYVSNPRMIQMNVLSEYDGEIIGQVIFQLKESSKKSLEKIAKKIFVPPPDISGVISYITRQHYVFDITGMGTKISTKSTDYIDAGFEKFPLARVMKYDGHQYSVSEKKSRKPTFGITGGPSGRTPIKTLEAMWAKMLNSPIEFRNAESFEDYALELEKTGYEAWGNFIWTGKKLVFDGDHSLSGNKPGQVCHRASIVEAIFLHSHPRKKKEKMCDFPGRPFVFSNSDITNTLTNLQQPVILLYVPTQGYRIAMIPPPSKFLKGKGKIYFVDEQHKRAMMYTAMLNMSLRFDNKCEVNSHAYEYLILFYRTLGYLVSGIVQRRDLVKTIKAMVKQAGWDKVPRAKKVVLGNPSEGSLVHIDDRMPDYLGLLMEQNPNLFRNPPEYGRNYIDDRVPDYLGLLMGK